MPSKCDRKLFTFILEWMGGTYIEQVSATNVKEATLGWANNLDFSLIDVLEKYKPEFISDVRNEDIVAIDLLEHIWCITPSINGTLALVNIIETACSDPVE